MPESVTVLNQTEVEAFTNNNSDNTIPEISNMFVSFMLCVFCFLTILLNSSLLYCFLTNRREQWVRNANQIIFLILSDLIVGVILLLRTAIIFMRMTNRPYNTCAMLSCIQTSTQAVSFYHIMAVWLHRYRIAKRINAPFTLDRR